MNYKLAEKNPLKFYDQVFNQDIKKTKVAEDKNIKMANEEKKRVKEEKHPGSTYKTKKAPVAVTSKITKRPHMKIMEKITKKI